MILVPNNMNMIMKKTVNFIVTMFGLFVGIGLIFSVVGFHVFSAGAQSVSSGTVQTSTVSSPFTLQLGDTSVAVTALQELLVKQGYLSVSVPTGYFGPLTQAAVIAFQKAKNLPQTGVMTVPANGADILFKSVASSFSSATIGSTGSHIGSVQQFLINRGLLHITTSTNYFGSMTQAAVIAFQKSHGLPQTGIVDQATFAAMNGQ